jgi:hypothetical protein
VDYEELQEAAFHLEAFEDEALTWAPFPPDVTNGTEVFVAQANFMPGGCILMAAICRAVLDDMGVSCVLDIWAENCRDVQFGISPQTTLPRDASERDLLERNWAEDGAGRQTGSCY